MLNRRTIRIKAMQSIFAYEQCKEANYHLALDQIAETFSPDLNSMEVQDKALLKEQSQEATKIFKARFKDKGKKVKDSDTDQINDEVNSAIKSYYNHLGKDSKFLKKEMLKDAELIYARFSWLLYWLDAMVKSLATLKLKKGIYTYSNFIDNQVINTILGHNGLSKAFIKSGLTWDDQKGETLVWLNEVILKDEQIINYLDLEKPRFEDDKEIVQYIYKSAIFKNADIIGLFMEQADLYWSENKAILRSMVLKTIKSVEVDNEDFELAELSYNWEEDKQFFETIFDQTVKESINYEQIIADKTLNWDIERISDTDRILLQMAIQEMINFPGIPLKVTINEYIEVSKKYSTPKSKQFINGVLDVIAVDLQKEGVIKKSGRGLIDNK
jgi:N utilization substance protein B